MAKKSNTKLYLLLAGGLGAAAFLFFRSRKVSVVAPPVASAPVGRNLSIPEQRYEWKTKDPKFASVPHRAPDRWCFDHSLRRSIDADVCDTYLPS